jgi:hypothetical protein
MSGKGAILVSTRQNMQFNKFIAIAVSMSNMVGAVRADDTDAQRAAPSDGDAVGGARPGAL